MKRIGIMGGNFDPPHIGHLAIAKTVKDALSLEEMRLVPNGRISYKKNQNSASLDDRFRMVALAIEGYDGFLLDEIERNREGYTYTCLTLADLKKQEPETAFTFVVGADSLDYMEQWVHPEQVFSLAEIAVVLRPGFSKQAIKEKAWELEQRFGAKIHLIPMKEIPISSTEIRKRLVQGCSVKEWIPEKVETYIRQRHLYGG